MACTDSRRPNRYDYLTHVVFKLYENTNVGDDDPARFRLEASFSPGVMPLDRMTASSAKARRPPLQRRFGILRSHVTLDDVERAFERVLGEKDATE